MVNKKIIIDIPFNVKFHPFYPEFYQYNSSSYSNSLSPEWINYRLNIFFNYTLKSLLHQTNQSFLCILRYDKSSENVILDSLSKYPKLPNNIIFTPNGDEILKSAIKGYEYLYHVRLDSDNLYHPNYIDQIDSFIYKEGLECILCQNGYIYDIINNNLAELYHYSPSFYTLIYKTTDYINGFRYKISGDHLGAINLSHSILPNRLYMITTHEKNVSNKFNYIVQQFSSIGPTKIISDDILKKSILNDWYI